MTGTLFGKIWDRHVVAMRGSSDALLYVDRCILHDGTMHVFDDLRKLKRKAARPQQIVGVVGEVWRQAAWRIRHGGRPPVHESAPTSRARDAFQCSPPSRYSTDGLDARIGWLGARSV